MAAKKSSGGKTTARTRPTLASSHAKKAAAPTTTRTPKRATSSRTGASKRVAAPPAPPLPVTSSAKERRPHEVATPKLSRPKAPPAPPTSLASDKARDLAIQVAVAAIEKKAVALEILDVAGRVDYADFLVIMTGRSDRQVNALAQGIEESLKRKGQRPMAIEGLPHANWVIMDYGDVVVHVFQDDARRLYDIESLWIDARRVAVPEDEATAPR